MASASRSISTEAAMSRKWKPTEAPIRGKNGGSACPRGRPQQHLLSDQCVLLEARASDGQHIEIEGFRADGKEFEAEFTADGRLIKMEVKD
jgi:hypothetical protein